MAKKITLLGSTGSIGWIPELLPPWPVCPELSGASRRLTDTTWPKVSFFSSPSIPASAFLQMNPDDSAMVRRSFSTASS